MLQTKISLKEKGDWYARSQKGRGRGRGRGRGERGGYHPPNKEEREQTSNQTKRCGRLNNSRPQGRRYDKFQSNVIIVKNMVIMLRSVEVLLTRLKRKPIMLKMKMLSELYYWLTKENKVGEKNLWYLDNAVNNHMCGENSEFVELEESLNGNSTFGDLSKVNFNSLEKWRTIINY